MYGSLEPWAFDPETLQKKILETTAGATGKDNPLFKLQEDLESGEFLPGRGILDMKSGLAAGISILSSFAHPRERTGNILLCAVADEEGSSQGMKAAASMLQGYLDEKGLEPVAVFNLDSAVDQDSGEQGRAIFTGSVGKTLPFVFFIGKCTHAGAPFDGINPVLPASEFAIEVESNPDAFQERQTVPGEEAPPPTILYFRESRTAYDVTTPPCVFCAVNVLSHIQNPEDIIETTGKIAKAAMDRSISMLRERASTLSRRVSGHFSLPAKTPTILDFDEYANLAERMSPGILDSARSFAAKQFPHDKVQQTLSVLHSLLPFSGTEGPTAVVGFAPPYYARVEFDRGRYSGFLEMIRSEISSFSREIGKSMKLRPFFPGISDMSFLAPSDNSEQRSYVRSQMPIEDASSSEETRISIACPVVNLGPWGRDYHQMGERVHRRYSFEEMPILLCRLVRAALDMKSGSHEEH
jgi:arginine utilization protein RocB